MNCFMLIGIPVLDYISSDIFAATNLLVAFLNALFTIRESPRVGAPSAFLLSCIYGSIA